MECNVATCNLPHLECPENSLITSVQAREEQDVNRSTYLSNSCVSGRRGASLCGSLITLLCLGGCGSPGEKSESNGTAAPVATASDTPAKVASSDKTSIKFKSDDGNTAFYVKTMPDGFKIEDASNKEIARLKRTDDKIKVKDQDENVLGYIIGGSNRYRIKDANQSAVLWELQRQEDGDWKLQDGNEKLVYKVKKRDYGFEIEDSKEQSLYKVKSKDGKTSLRNSKEESVFYTKDEFPVHAVFCLGFDAIESQKLRIALMAAISN